MFYNKSAALNAASNFNPKPRPTRVAVVGGGFSGTTAVVNLVRLLLQSGKQKGKQSPLEIFWFDRNNAFGRGLPYARQASNYEDVFILNQPAYAQSPLSDHPDLYTNWLRRRSRGFTRNSFTSRALFGSFLASLYEKHCRLAKRHRLPVRIHRITAEVTDLESEADGFVVKLKGATAPVNVDFAILAFGHQRNDRFATLSCAGGYVQNPYDLADYRRALASVKNARNVIPVGGGPTTVDAVRALEHINYKGRYTVIASAGGSPWAFDPELYWQRPIGSYKFLHLVPCKVGPDADYETLTKALACELRNAHATGCGDGHVYYGADIRTLFPDPARVGPGVQRFIKDLIYLKGAVTAPENCVIYQRLRQARRIRIVRGRAVPAKTSYDRAAGRFRVAVERKSGRVDNLRGDILINCSQLPKGIEQPVRNELLSNLLAKGWLKLTEDALIAPADAEASSKIFVLGPYAQPPNGTLRSVWGVESFRDEVSAAAKEVIRCYVENRAVPEIQNGDQRKDPQF